MLTVSIAIHNPDIDIFRKMLLSLKKYTPELSQLIIADNGSEKKDFVGIVHSVIPSEALHQTVQGKVDPQDPAVEDPTYRGESQGDNNIGVQIIHHPENLGFGRAHNENLKVATGKYFAVLNDDIEFFENWSTDMIEILEKNPDIAQIGMRTGVFNMLTQDSHAYYEDREDPDYIEGSCFIMPIEIAKSFSLFDESYEFAYCEDSDLSLRLKKAGYIIHAIKKNWKHYRAKTSSKVNIDLKGYHANNEYLFRKRWNSYLLSKRFGKTIVIKREASIGDVFLVTPIVRALKEKESDSVIILMTKTPQAIMNNPDIDFIISMNIPFPCDEFIDLDYAYEKDFRKHIVDAYAEVAGVKVNKRTGILPSNKGNVFDSVIPENFGRFALLDLSDTWTGKQWPKAYYRELSKKLREDGTKVVIFGLTNEIHDVPYDLTFINVLVDISKTIDLIKKANIFIGHEGLCAHLAQAAGISSIIIFGCSLPEYTLDISIKNLRTIQTEAECRGCRHRYMSGTTILCPRNHECMKMISVDRVFNSYKELVMSNEQCVSFS